MSFDVNDKESMALCAWREARGQGPMGMRAVMWVIKNRVGAPGFASTMHDVIYGKNQFTSMSVPSDSQFHLEPSGASWDEAQTLAAQVIEGLLLDPTFGARYYANLRSMDQEGWFQRNIVAHPEVHRHTTAIGQHDFYL